MSNKPVDVEDPEFVEEPEDLEYNVEIINPHHFPAAKLTEMLNAGWHLDHEIACPPYVILFFSRLKEAEGE